MPYQVGGGAQGDSGNPAVEDVFHSPDVYVNGVAVALWNPPSASGSSGGSVSAVSWGPFPHVSDIFATTAPSPPVLVDPVQQAAAEQTLAAYKANPAQFYNPAAAASGVKPNYQGTPNVSTTDSSGNPTDGIVPTSASASDIPAFLAKCLNDTQTNTPGTWRETGMPPGNGPSNPNIVGIWKNLGFPQTAYWQTDQTPWCMGFVNFTLKACGYRYVQEASARAIQANPGRWNATPIDLNSGQPGDIALWSFGHVNFVYTAGGSTTGSGPPYTFVGGNQTPHPKAGQPQNNPDDGDVTISWPNGYKPPGNGTLVGLWRPSKT